MGRIGYTSGVPAFLRYKRLLMARPAEYAAILISIGTMIFFRSQVMSFPATISFRTAILIHDSIVASFAMTMGLERALTFTGAIPESRMDYFI